jgi:hypothetical protein
MKESLDIKITINSAAAIILSDRWIGEDVKLDEARKTVALVYDLGFTEQDELVAYSVVALKLKQRTVASATANRAGGLPT